MQAVVPRASGSLSEIDLPPEAKAQTNFTDPDAKITKRSNKGFDYCYNAQAVVDSAHQIIVAAEATVAAVSVGTTLESPKEAMSRKLRTESGRLLYAARKHIVEPVFGQIKRIRGFRKFSQRGLELIAAEWQLICLTHNLHKIWRCAFRPG